MLNNISPIDGRYRKKLEILSDYFSEFALIKKRLFVQLMYLKELGKGDFLDIHKKFDVEEGEKVKEIEDETNHDVKAVEYYLKEKLPKNVKEYVHYGLTSEDINNLAYNLLIKDFLQIYYKKIEDLLDKLHKLSQEYKERAMLGRTHGQPASPTTLGKEFFVFFTRLKAQLDKLKEIKLKGKLNGATGNYNALYFVEPERDWLSFSKKFIDTLGLEVNLITTQVEPKDTLVELFQNVKRINNIILDLDRDVWYYISIEYFKLKRVEKEVGSSTMPHKVNPIDFENSEGNLNIANSFFSAFENLQISRLQRDLSDSTMMRNIGVGFAHSMLAYDSTLRGLGKLEANEDIIEMDMEKHPEVLTEAVQTFLRREGKEGGYEILKDLSRGKTVDIEKLHEFIDSLNVDKETKKKLKGLKVEDYVGLAKDLVS